MLQLAAVAILLLGARAAADPSCRRRASREARVIWAFGHISGEKGGTAATLLHSAQPVRRAPHLNLRIAHAYNLLLPPLTLFRTDRTIA